MRTAELRVCCELQSSRGLMGLQVVCSLRRTGSTWSSGSCDGMLESIRPTAPAALSCVAALSLSCINGCSACNHIQHAVRCCWMYCLQPNSKRSQHTQCLTNACNVLQHCVFDSACDTLMLLKDSEGTVSLGVCVFLMSNRLVDHALIVVLCMQLM